MAKPERYTTSKILQELRVAGINSTLLAVVARLIKKQAGCMYCSDKAWSEPGGSLLSLKNDNVL